MTAPWSATDPGTGEHEWIAQTPWSDLGTVDVAEMVRRFPSVVVVAAHPDDETLGCGAFIAELRAAGAEVTVVLATDGEGAHCAHGRITSDAVRQTRRAEVQAAMSVLHAGDSDDHAGKDMGSDAIVALDLRDGHLCDAEGDLRRALADVVQQRNASGEVLLLAPSRDDGHPDHEAAGDAAAHVAKDSGAKVAYFPIWWWHWGRPADFAWSHAVAVAPGATALAAKQLAISCFISQTHALGAGPEHATLPPQVMRRFDRVVEVLLDPAGVLPHSQAHGFTPSENFDEMFDGTDDPWGTDSTWYEQRRSDIIEAVLPTQDLGRVLDLGCSTGSLSVRLAARASSVLAVDGSELALEVAAKRDADNVTWLLGHLPHDLADLGTDGATFDTIVISEVGYFLDGKHLLWLLAEVDRLLADDGVVLVANWQLPTTQIPLDGKAVDRQVAAMWSQVASYRDDHVAIRVCGRR